MGFRLVPKSVTLNGVMAVTLRYFTEFGKHTFQHVTAASICSGIYARVYCIPYFLYDVVVQKVHVRYLISWWVSCIICPMLLTHWADNNRALKHQLSPFSEIIAVLRRCVLLTHSFIPLFSGTVLEKNHYVFLYRFIRRYQQLAEVFGRTWRNDSRI